MIFLQKDKPYIHCLCVSVAPRGCLLQSKNLYVRVDLCKAKIFSAKQKSLCNVYLNRQMTDTRKKAWRGDYEKEQEINLGHLEYYGNPENYFGKPLTTYHPGNGLIGAKVCNMDLANNTLDIVNLLRGTGSANMVNPSVPAKPDVKYIKSLNLFDKYVYLPDPLVLHKDQRPAWQ